LVELTERQRKALAYVRTHGKVTRGEYERLSGLPPYTAKRDLAALVREGFLLMRGAGRKQWYELRSTESVPQTRDDNET